MAFAMLVERARNLRARPSRIAAAVAATALLFCGGCVDQTTDGDVTEFKLATWIQAAVALVCVGLAVVAWVSRRGQHMGSRIAVVSLFVLAALFVLPQMYLDRVRIGPNRLQARKGVWVSPELLDVQFDQLMSVHIVGKEKYSRRGGTRTDYTLICTTHDGTTTRWETGTVLDAAMPHLVSVLRQRGVSVTEPAE